MQKERKPNNASGSKSFAKPQRKDFIKPNKDFVKPQKDFSRPKQDKDSAKPQKDFDRPRKDFGKPQKDFDRPRKDFGKSQKDYSKPQNEIPGQEHAADEAERLEGRNSVTEALKANRTINKIFVSRGDKEGSINYIIALAKEKGIIVQEVERAKLDSLSLTRSHQGIIAFVSAKEYVEVDDILEVAASKGEQPFIILLDEITDPNNFGSILRTADAVGAHGVIIPKRRAIGLTASVSKASAGALEYVPVARVTNLGQTIDYLKKNNIWVVGTDISGEKPFYGSDLKGPIALVIGSEGEGIGKLVREKCDFVVNIPMKGKVSSLNAGVAGAIVMYEILKQRSK